MPSPDLAKQQPGLDSPSRGCAAVTPSDSADLPRDARALYVGIGGDLKVTTVDGNTVEFRSLPSGSILPVSVRRVYATGQTGTIASAIVALY